MVCRHQRVQQPGDLMPASERFFKPAAEEIRDRFLVVSHGHQLGGDCRVLADNGVSSGDLRLGHETIAAPMAGHDERWLGAAIANGPACLEDGGCYHTIGDMPALPDLIDQLIFRHDVVAISNQEDEQVERQRFDGLILPVQGDLPKVRAHLAAPESEYLYIHAAPEA
jgi:hypothetical protein